MHALNKESGLKALTGVSMMQDIRKRANEGDAAADTALSIFAYRAAKYIGAYWLPCRNPCHSFYGGIEKMKHL